jgi:AraC-like DNA-binding protein
MSRALSVFHGPFGRVSLYELDRPLIKHAHREAHLIFFVGGMRGRVTYNHADVTIDHDTAAAVNPWEAHGFCPIRAQGCGLYLIFYLKPAWLGATMGRDVSSRTLFPSPKVQMNPRIREFRDDLCGLLMQRSDDQQAFEGLLESLIQSLEIFPLSSSGQGVGAQPVGNPALGGHAAPLWLGLDYRVRKSLAALSTEQVAVGNLDEIARQSGLSRAHFFSLFHQQIGVTPVVYTNTLRIEAALDQIVRTGISVTSISHQLGFSCQSAFTRFFVSNVGMAPTDYRRAIQVFGARGHA